MARSKPAKAAKTANASNRFFMGFPRADFLDSMVRFCSAGPSAAMTQVKRTAQRTIYPQLRFRRLARSLCVTTGSGDQRREHAPRIVRSCNADDERKHQQRRKIASHLRRARASAPERQRAEHD